jgi:hypothetical protein
MNIANVSVNDLRRAITIKEEIESLTAELAGILGESGGDTPKRLGRPPGRKNRMSGAGRARIAAAQRARWAKNKGKGTAFAVESKPKRKMSADGRAKISAAAKKRWAAVKAAGKSQL